MRKLLPRARHIWKYWYHSYLNNPFEQTIFESNKTKEQRETMKLQKKKLCSEALKTLIKELNRPGREVVQN